MNQADINAGKLDRPPLVSVIIPVFNRAGSLPAALRSVADQTFTDWEAIVVDDCSSDGSADVALEAGPLGKVRVIRHEKNQGPSAARNTGILEARGRYVSFLDSDDSWHPEKLARQVEMVEADSNPDMVFCVTQTVVFRGGKRLRVQPQRGPHPDEPWCEFLYMNGGYAQTNSFLLSRDLAMKAGFESCHEDHYLFLKAGALGARYRLVAEPLSNWNDDSRIDRVSHNANIDLSRDYLIRVRELMTTRAKLAYEVRQIGPLLLRKSPLQAMKLFRQGLREGAVMHRDILSVFTRFVLPSPAVAYLRRLYYSAAG